jgi:octanoyl-[GcvH]:protein N-octanoyltransferase
LRLWRPLRPALSVGRLDARHPRAGDVLALARTAGVPAVRRLAGGRAATLDAGCLCLGWAQPDPKLEESSARYELIAGAIMEALGELGVDASLGESPGEWCPGAWSVHGPAGKLAGLAQRVVSGGAWCEALIVIEAAPELRSLARQVHAMLELEWREDAQGELRALLPDDQQPHLRLGEALIAALERRLDAVHPAPLPIAVRDRAVGLAGEHRLA